MITKSTVCEILYNILRWTVLFFLRKNNEWEERVEIYIFWWKWKEVVGKKGHYEWMTFAYYMWQAAKGSKQLGDSLKSQ